MILDTNRDNHQDEAMQLRVVKRCHRYARLNQRGALSRADEKQLSALGRLLEGDSGPARRAHMRFPLLLSAKIHTERGRYTATVINMSGGGLMVVTSILLTPGSRVKVTIGRGPSALSFRCVARRVTRHGTTIGIGFQFAHRVSSQVMPIAA